MQNTAGGRVGKRLMSNEQIQFFDKKKKSSQLVKDLTELSSPKDPLAQTGI
jgi:hypothetical protein